MFVLLELSAESAIDLSIVNRPRNGSDTVGNIKVVFIVV